ncbi:MAG: SRPBCC family protein [Candidatus Liptonbacteria bacterium]|nr:SRPBCC family protein [Candidatus Liptonbacteria bacterium]
MIKTKTIKQVITFKVSPSVVYNALMDSKTHSKFTGGKASISKRVGGKFTAFDEYCSGENLELVDGKRIVQSWTATEWPKGHYSKVTYELKKDGIGTKLLFTQTGVPIEYYKSILQGWKDYYWNPMKEMFN